MKINGEFVLRDVVGEAILVPVGNTALKMNGMVTLTPVAAEIWKCLEKEATYDELLEHILEEFDVDEEIARGDLDEFLDQLRKEDFIIE